MNNALSTNVHKLKVLTQTLLTNLGRDKPIFHIKSTRYVYAWAL